MRKFVVLGIAAMATALVHCSSGQEESEAEHVESTTEALNPASFSGWTAIPGNSNFFGKPALLTQYTSPTNRDWSICGTTFSNTVLCNFRIILGNDSGWGAWTTLAPPTGVVFGASSPSMASFNDNAGNTYGAIAVRQNGGSCSNCLWVQISQHAVSSTWYPIPNSGINNGGFTGDVALVNSGQYLYIFAVEGGSTYSGLYTQNYIGNGYSNTGWTAWTAIPGGGVFNRTLSAAPLPGGSGVIVTGIGTDSRAYFQKYMFADTWDGGWSLFAPGAVFTNGGAGSGLFANNDSLGATSFSLTGADLEIFGVAGSLSEYEGDLGLSTNGFNGWFQLTSGTFFSSPTAVAPTTSHIDFAALGNTRQFYTAEYNYSTARCADGTQEQTFGHGAVGCSGTVQWPSRASLCGAGTRVCTSGDWVADETVPPLHDYWTNDNLLWSGGGPNSCEASTTAGNACTTNEPMRVCTLNGSPAGTDPEGNVCNWTGCGLNAMSPNAYLGGCDGNATAGTLCCPAMTASCADGTTEQTFANGAVGCSGTATWPGAFLCAAGSHVCSSAEWSADRGSTVPSHDYWTSDNLMWSGGGPNNCEASTTGGNACTTNEPMRVCTPNGSPAGTDPEGNVCNWTGCGLNATTPNQYLGGCNGNMTAGALCCPGQ